MIQVIKVDGGREPYSEDKIRASAARVGVPPALQEAMLKEIRTKLYDGISTSDIFATIKQYLAKSPEPYLAAKYNLKSALALLGPSGYPFEQYLAHLLTNLGFTVKTNQVIEGSCVAHEVDLLAVKDGVTHFVEAKFHTRPAQRTDVKVTLYIRARYEDLAAKAVGVTKPWIITNTRFTTEAVKYARCRDIQLTSWGYPKGEGIMDLIEQTHLHPITILSGLTKEDLRLLFSQDIVVCRQLVGDKAAASLIPSGNRAAVLAEAASICQSR